MGQAGIQDQKPCDLSDLILRPYRSSDRRAGFDVYYDAVRNGAARAYTSEQRAAWAPADAFRPETPDQMLDMVAFVAEHPDCAGRIEGFMAMERNGHLDRAFVRPGWMGRGLAQNLYDLLLEWARGAGLTQLTTEASHLARPFFAKNGWQVVAPEIITRDGVEIERFRMSLAL
ncbi:GNAT family N-acetyltransferase [Halocynthiibacter styelae]|uniref:GNAT family N-acetyltransferase n=1 Tax=Halocynthiibacter styelae TaxID=2761955 RepID=A0A8J7IMH1_9RHOB|nr:GNAT family N-acetyltransferase [Paenihalocynthiibacter styelae]MBI1493321.1 GNAT family N-acetyltransferase [Paenihalocynthiibacter styelae]